MLSRTAGGVNMAQNCSLAQTWVRENYERNPDGVVAKSVIYKNYEEYCRQVGRPIMETSIFGRVVKQVFPDVNIRRLGGRENLKYYYCGIYAKASSPYASDNDNTTRPKRKQRKRDALPDKTETQHCLRFLLSRTAANHEGSVSKSDLYALYSQCSSSWTSEPLTIQQFSNIVQNAFGKIVKRKVFSRCPQHDFFMGISIRSPPLDLNSIPQNELLSLYESLSSSSKMVTYREGSNTPDEEDEFNCRSPASEGSDLSAGNSESSCHELKVEPLSDQYFIQIDDTIIKNEPVDYRISTLRLKDEPLDDEMSSAAKDDYSNDSANCVYTAQGLATRMDLSSPSSSPPSQVSAANRIYKPRFHINYHEYNWTGKSEVFKVESSEESATHQWLIECLQKSLEICVQREQLYSLYERYCHQTNSDILPLNQFDILFLNIFKPTSIIQTSIGCYYMGVSVIHNSDIDGRVRERLCREIVDDTPIWGSQSNVSLDMQASPSGNTDIEDDEDPLDDDSIIDDKYPETAEDDLQSIPEVLRDGKYYLKTWLTDNFEIFPDACVLKAEAYQHYEAYAKSVLQTPLEMNVFGKVVRQVFPGVGIRRLGGRSKPQYHYCGITAKPSSSLYATMGGKDPAQRSRKKEIATDNRSAEVAIDWLKMNYQPGNDNIMKNDVYQSYCSYCSTINEHPVTLNYFGKLVKHCFPRVEVRKFGGRAEPSWFYQGIIPINRSLQMSYEEDCDTSAINPYMKSGGQLQLTHGIPHRPMTASNPIDVPRGGNISAHESLYRSESTQSSAAALSQRYMQAHQFGTPHMGSPFVGSAVEPRSALTPEPYPHSPGLSRALRESLVTHGSLNTGRVMVRSPYDSADVAPESIFPRSPEDAAAQTCRSPSVSYTDGTSHLMSYLTQGLMSSSSSPNCKRGQIVPSQTPPPPPAYASPSLIVQPGGLHATLSAAHLQKRVKHEEAAPRDYSSGGFSGRS